MTAIGVPFNLLNGLSDFWQRLFADTDQLDALYRGTALLVGQAYLDLMSATLGIALQDAVVLDREVYRLVTLREDEVAYQEGPTLAEARWTYALPAPLVTFGSLDNRVIEPTQMLEEHRDYTIDAALLRLVEDPTDVAQSGAPLAGYARRSLDVEVGGSFSDAGITDWRTTTDVRKGDTLRLLDIAPDGTQLLRGDYPIVLVRAAALYVAAATPLPPPAANVTYVIIRKPSPHSVAGASLPLVVGTTQLPRTRLTAGTVRVYARGPTGADVVEGADYIINYEQGLLYPLTAWQNTPGPFGLDYQWARDVYPSGGALPYAAATGRILTSRTTTRVTEVALWAPNAGVDRRTLANNFGALIGRQAPSTEAYRAFLTGIFKLYTLGPVLERIESALNVVLNLPVVRDDGEVFVNIDTTDPSVDYVQTQRDTGGQLARYRFPKNTPFRPDLVPGLVLNSFEPLTTVVAVTDYIQTPDWWHGQTIPETLFAAAEGQRLDASRRIATSAYVPHVIGPDDGACIGDVGLYIGADERGQAFTNGALPLRRRLAFVLMDRYLKYHTFSVKFDALAVSAQQGTAFAQSLQDLNELVLAARPAHTYGFTTPNTAFRDRVDMQERDISFNRLVGSRLSGPDKIVFTDTPLLIGVNDWLIGDYAAYELQTVMTSFPTPGLPVVLAGAPAAPRRGRFVGVYLAGSIGGQALRENVDYVVDIVARTVTRLTAWDTSTVAVMFRQLSIGNVADAPPAAGDLVLALGSIDPALLTAAFSATATGWDGATTPPTAPRDLGFVERPLMIHVHP